MDTATDAPAAGEAFAEEPQLQEPEQEPADVEPEHQDQDQDQDEEPPVVPWDPAALFGLEAPQVIELPDVDAAAAG